MVTYHNTHVAISQKVASYRSKILWCVVTKTIFKWENINRVAALAFCTQKKLMADKLFVDWSWTTKSAKSFTASVLCYVTIILWISLHGFSVYLRKVQEIVIGNIIQGIVGIITSAIISYHCKIGQRESTMHLLINRTRF